MKYIVTLLIIIIIILSSIIIFNRKDNAIIENNYIHKIDSLNKIQDTLMYINNKLAIDIKSKYKSDTILITKIKYIENEKPANFSKLPIDSNIKFLSKYLSK